MNKNGCLRKFDVKGFVEDFSDASPSSKGFQAKKSKLEKEGGKGNKRDRGSGVGADRPASKKTRGK